jgi:Leucine-rich repeat (LRR) protein
VAWNFSSSTNNPCTEEWSGLTCAFPSPYVVYFVVAIELPSYNLQGTLPDSIAAFQHLQELNVRHNSITSTLPASIGDLLELQALNIQGNQINGTIPAEIGQLSQLGILSLERNQFQGKIPSSLGNLTNIIAMDLGNNLLTGTLPPSLGQLENMQHGIFFFNSLTGTIPTSFSGLRAIKTFNVFNNSMHGAIPELFCDRKNLTMLTFGFNSFTGTLPPCLSMLPNLTYIDLYSNLLTGTIPASFADMPKLNILYLNINKMHGAVDVLCNIATLAQFYLERNDFSGTVPACFGDLPDLANAYLFGNQLTGTIPANWGKPPNLKYIDLGQNLLTGQLPDSIGNLADLSFLYLFENLLTGTLPDSYARLSKLSLLLLQDNFLTGPIAGKFNGSHQTLLNTIQLSGNAFTGSIPGDELFAHAHRLRTFSAVDNCLQGSIPEVICESRRLNLLALDGAGSAEACHYDIVPGVSSSYISRNPITGGVPTCLLQMHNLTTLHLSGNGLTGSLPQDLTLGPMLIDLALSHNMLTGRIPHSIQERIWYSLDLSYNRLSGTLDSAFNTKPVNINLEKEKFGILDVQFHYTSVNTYLSLQNNRLSGEIPSSVYPLQDLSILNGNLFACGWQQNDLPPHDSARDSFQCGSALFDAQLYAWIIFLGTCVFVVTVTHRNRAVLARYFQVEEAVEWCQNWLFAVHQPGLRQKLRNFHFVCEVADIVGRVSVWCTLAIVLVLGPVYAACSRYYGTITYQYAWTLSAAFLSGPVPFSLEFVFFVCLMLLLSYLMQRYKRVYLKITDEDADFDMRSSRASLAVVTATNKQIYSAYATFFAINFVLVIGVNVAFVYIALYQDSDALAVAQLFLSFFKGFWNSVGAMYLMRWSFNTVATNDTTRADFINTQLFVSLFNNIGVPCLVVVTISPSCFYNVFVTPPSVSFRYVYLECAIFIKDTCLFLYPAQATTSYEPPFTYSYQCGAQFITSYAPTFVYLAIETAFITPIALIVLTRLHKRATPGTLWHRALDYAMYKSMKPLDCTSYVDCGNRLLRDVYEPFFDANQLMVLLLTYLGIILTFGVVFPPLAVVMMVAVVSLVVTNRLIMGRYIAAALKLQQEETQAREAARQQQVQQKRPSAYGSAGAPGLADQYLEVIELDSLGVGCLHLDKLRISVFMIACCCCMFYTIFFFDTLGNEQGAAASFWVFIAFPLIPAGIYFLSPLWRRNSRAKIQEVLVSGAAKAARVVEDGLELGTVLASTVTTNPLAAQSQSQQQQQQQQQQQEQHQEQTGEPVPPGQPEFAEGHGSTKLRSSEIVNRVPARYQM